MRNVVYEDFGKNHEEEESKEEVDKGKEEFRMAWIWVEGWRARLRGAGDVVEKYKREDEEWDRRGVVVYRE